MGFPRQEYWSGVPFPSLEDLPGPGIEPTPPALAGASLPLGHLGSLHICVCESMGPQTYIDTYMDHSAVH